MGLIIDTITENKEIFNKSISDGDSKILDLTKSSITYKGVNRSIKSIYIIDEYYQMRPDIIASIKYGDASRMGSLLKYNNISNPFSIDTGTVLLIPSDEMIEQTFLNKKELNEKNNLINNTNHVSMFRKTQEKKKFSQSEGRKSFIENKIKNKPEMVLPPNVLQPLEKTIDRKNGFYIFAPEAGYGGINTPIEEKE